MLNVEYQDTGNDSEEEIDHVNIEIIEEISVRPVTEEEVKKALNKLKMVKHKVWTTSVDRC